MDSHDFQETIFGGPGRSAGPREFSYCVYLPRSIPRSIQLDEATSSALSEADRAIGRLHGSGRRLKNPMILSDVYIRREAISSTRIEGTQATLDDLYDAESGGPVDDDVQEVINYVRALYRGLGHVQHSPITMDLVRDLHTTILEGVRGEDKQPGLLRERPNWISGSDPATAEFVPPPHTELDAGLADWESFLAEDLLMPPLVRCALMHYQFETLHPFFDGNGRLGRLLIVLFLIHDGHLPAPLLYVSSYFERHKREYYDALQGVRQRGDVGAWLRYFLSAVTVQANDAIRRSDRLADLEEEFRQRLSGSKGRAHELIDNLLSSPYISTQQVVQHLGVTPQGADYILRQLRKAGIVREMRRVPGRSKRWVAGEVMEILQEDSP
ncbi:MAG: cell filamentation protein Fic [Acidimicrobiaceae bacterium]|nr:cell filamentation protein Fic [Acidimicrobiaceae bacterium]